MARGRPPYGFVLLDLPSDHEVDTSLSTECEVISAVLANRRMKSRTKAIRMSSVENFHNDKNWKPYKEVGFVHIGGHGSKKGIGLIGGTVPWSKVSGKLCALAPTLAENQKRVLCLSCCFSIHAYKKMKKNLKGHFTACYYFKRKGIEFADAMTVWSMFYLKIGLENPHQEIANDINQYLGSQTISFVKI